IIPGIFFFHSQTKITFSEKNIILGTIVQVMIMRWLKKHSISILVLLYAVGALGFGIPMLRGYFVPLIPPFLLLLLFFLLWHHGEWSFRFVVWALFVIVFGIGIEWLGVRSGMIFGQYAYGTVLGPAIDTVPLIIGVNWLLLSYCTLDISRRVFDKAFWRVLLAASLMVILDLCIERVAVWLDFWHWKTDLIPPQNFLGWFLVSCFILTLTELGRLKWRNPVAPVVYLCMLAFFLMLNF